MVTCMVPRGIWQYRVTIVLLLATIKDPLMIEVKEREREGEREYIHLPLILLWDSLLLYSVICNSSFVLLHHFSIHYCASVMSSFVVCDVT